MKRLKLLPLLVFFIISLSSCNGISRTELLNHASDEDVANEKLIKIIDFIENKDEEGLRSIFSKRALDESEDFSENAELLFEYVDGDIISWEKDSGPTVFSSNDYGKVVKEVDAYYYVESNKETYFFMLNDFPEDDSNTENEGMNMLLVVRKDDSQDIYEEGILYKDGDRISPPGIYLPIQ